MRRHPLTAHTKHETVALIRIEILKKICVTFFWDTLYHMTAN